MGFLWTGGVILDLRWVSQEALSAPSLCALAKAAAHPEVPADGFPVPGFVGFCSCLLGFHSPAPFRNPCKCFLCVAQCSFV